MAHFAQPPQDVYSLMLLCVERGGQGGGGQSAGEEQFCRWWEQWGSWQLPRLKEAPIAAACCTNQAVERASFWRITAINSLPISQML